jgi:ParB family chromosome partitioning protein
VRLLALPSVVRAALLDERITEGHGRALLSLPTAEAQMAILQTILKRHLNVRQTEELVRRMLGQKPAAKPRPMDDEIKDIQTRLGQRLGTKVDIRHTSKGGRIIIHYYSDEELQALLEHIASD